MSSRSIATSGRTASCYFRTTAADGARKALVQIDERCNLHCAHCFVSATKAGSSMPYSAVTEILIPRLRACRVDRVTLTGGEPTVHPQFPGIVRAFRAAGMEVGVCTNATTLTDGQVSELASLGGVHVNVSLDGFRAQSHGRFRGDRGSFAVTLATVRKLAAAGLLQGLLCTPNSLAEDEEYRDLCEFAAANGAAYVLMNPLSSMGRGVKSRARLAGSDEHMRRIRDLTAPFGSPGLEVVHIRFPNDDGLPLAGCEAGTIIYVFTGGDVTVCPYLVFAARTPQSRHDPGEFVVGNIFTDPQISGLLDAYKLGERYQVGVNPTCGSCGISGECGKGCPAAVIASGERIGAVDTEVCPVTSGARRLLPLAPA
jgi:radical SAM protein with 4Fe4S-binding SPASM domain